MWLRTGQLANRVQDITLAYRCAVIMPEGGGIWELYHGCYLGYKPNQDIRIDIHCTCTCTFLSVFHSQARLRGTRYQCAYYMYYYNDDVKDKTSVYL